MAITLRLTKGSQLTFEEVDNNFKSLFYSSSLSGNVLNLYYYPGTSYHSIDLSGIGSGGGGGILGIKYNGTTVTSSADMLNFNSPLSASNTGDQIEITINTGSFVTNPQTGSYLVSASNSGGDAFQDITFTKGDGTTFVIDATPNHVHERVINKETGTLLKGTPVYVSGSTGNAVHVYAASASNSSRMPAALILDTNLNSDQEGFGLVIGFINGVNTSQFNAGDNVYVGANGGYTNVRPTGSNIQVQKLGNVIAVDASNGSGLITGAGRSNDVPNIQTGYLWVGNEDEVATPIATSSIQNVVSSSYALTASYALSGAGGGGVTINGNVNNRVVTATGTANTLQGESQLTFDGSTLNVNGNLNVNHNGDQGSQFKLVTSSLYYNSFIDTRTIGRSNNDIGDLVIFNIDSSATYSLDDDGAMTAGRIFKFRNWDTDYSASAASLYVTTSMADTYFGLANVEGSASIDFTLNEGLITLMYVPSMSLGGNVWNMFMQIDGDRLTQITYKS